MVIEISSGDPTVGQVVWDEQGASYKVMGLGVGGGADPNRRMIMLAQISEQSVILRAGSRLSDLRRPGY